MSRRTRKLTDDELAFAIWENADEQAAEELYTRHDSDLYTVIHRLRGYSEELDDKLSSLLSTRILIRDASKQCWRDGTPFEVALRTLARKVLEERAVEYAEILEVVATYEAPHLRPGIQTLRLQEPTNILITVAITRKNGIDTPLQTEDGFLEPRHLAAFLGLTENAVRIRATRMSKLMNEANDADRMSQLPAEKESKNEK